MSDRILVGEQVVLSPSFVDDGRDVMNKGVGTLQEDDRTRIPYLVRWSDGTINWFRADDIIRFTGEAAPKAVKSHILLTQMPLDAMQRTTSPAILIRNQAIGEAIDLNQSGAHFITTERAATELIGRSGDWSYRRMSAGDVRRYYKHAYAMVDGKVIEILDVVFATKEVTQYNVGKLYTIQLDGASTFKGIDNGDVVRLMAQEGRNYLGEAAYLVKPINKGDAIWVNPRTMLTSFE